MGTHRLTTDWANRPNVVYVDGNGVHRVSPKRVWTRNGWDDGYSQTEVISRHRYGGRLDDRPVEYGDTFPVA